MTTSSRARREDESASVVCVGSFNPQIFQPSWFGAHGLLREEEAEGATVDIVHGSLTSFRTEWLGLQVTRDRLVATALHAPFEAMRDLVISALSLLQHTPVSAVGLNRDAHYAMSSREEWMDLGHRLAPPEHWEGVLEEAGVRSLTMQGIRKDDPPGYVRFTFEPSNTIQFGVFMSVNRHFEVDEKTASSATWAVEVLRNQWDAAMAKAEQGMNRVAGT